MSSIVKKNNLELNEIVKDFLNENGLCLREIKHIYDMEYGYMSYIYIKELTDVFCVIEMSRPSSFIRVSDEEDGVRRIEKHIYKSLKWALDDYRKDIKRSDEK
jgi:hypothetical protein